MRHSGSYFRFTQLVLFLALSLAIQAGQAWAQPKSVRWTAAEDTNAELSHVLDVILAKTGYTFTAADFLLIEERDLASSHFQTYQQLAQGIPLSRMSVRIWSDLSSKATLQVEARVEDPAQIQPLPLMLSRLSPAIARTLTQRGATDAESTRLVHAAVRLHRDDRSIRSIRWSTEWRNEALVRTAQVKSKHGTHTVSVKLLPGGRPSVIENTYEEFPQSGEFAVPALVYPIYEEAEGSHTLLPRVASELKYLSQEVAKPTKDPYTALQTQHFYEEMLDPILGETAEGRLKGYWAMSYIKRQAELIRSQLPLEYNQFGKSGTILTGRYATINLHPDAVTQFKGLNFTPAVSSNFRPSWAPTLVNGIEVWEMIPTGTRLGRPLATAAEVLTRPAHRLPDHDPETYLNDGFDEIQVYWSINTLMETLQKNGFTDPELSTRPFNAFLYDPSLGYRDNAYYTDDTINFTTYSSTSGNAARDNSTIWHELGHGIMDRLMGDYIRLADTGGLGEGMADFVAALVIADVTKNQPFAGSTDFRIINKVGFHLTNEVHDDGEAYGGAMRDLLVGAIQRFGVEPGVKKVTDLTLESMRLSRNHPGLTAEDWFIHMLFADELGRPGLRAPGELKDLVLTALAGRNFTFEGLSDAKFTVMNGVDELTDRGPGSRNRPIVHELAETDQVNYALQLSLKNGGSYSFKFPVTVKVFFRSGALQGAIHWKGEEAEPLTYTLATEADMVTVPLEASGKCDYSNREDGSCVDYAYLQIWNDGETEKPQAKKRFYLRIFSKP